MPRHRNDGGVVWTCLGQIGRNRPSFRPTMIGIEVRVRPVSSKATVPPGIGIPVNAWAAMWSRNLCGSALPVISIACAIISPAP